MIDIFQLKKELDYIKSGIAYLNSVLPQLPSDHICIRKRGNSFAYSSCEKSADGKIIEHYISVNEKAYLTETTKGRYYRKLLKALEKEARVIQSFLSNYSPNEKIRAWDVMPKGSKELIEPIYISTKEKIKVWENAVFETNAFPMENRNLYVTKKGECVRSRIELIIANLLFDLGIPYRYECRLDLNTGTVFPDYTVLHPKTLELYYIEIFGKMDDPMYASAAFKKINKYASSKYYDKLIMFFDHKDSPISVKDVKQAFESIFLN